MRAAWFALGLFAACGACAGQSAEFLVPSVYSVAAGGRVQFSTQSGVSTGPLLTEWPREVDRFFIRVAGIQDNRAELPPTDGEEWVCTFTLNEPGVTMLVLDWKPRVLTLEPAQFREFLAAHVEGAKQDQVPDGAPVRVRHVKSAKCLLHVAAAGAQPPDAATGTSKSGQTVEIRATFDPTRTPPGADVGVRVYIHGDSEAGVRVRSVHATSGQESSFVTNAKGSGDIRITAAGPWRVEFHQARRLTDDPGADWEVFSGTLTFSAPSELPGVERAKP